MGPSKGARRPSLPPGPFPAGGKVTGQNPRNQDQEIGQLQRHSHRLDFPPSGSESGKPSATATAGHPDAGGDGCHAHANRLHPSKPAIACTI